MDMDQDLLTMSEDALRQEVAAFRQIARALVTQRQAGDVNESCWLDTENELIRRLPECAGQTSNSLFNLTTRTPMTHSQFRNNCGHYGNAVCARGLLICDEKHEHKVE